MMDQPCPTNRCIVRIINKLTAPSVTRHNNYSILKNRAYNYISEEGKKKGMKLIM